MANGATAQCADCYAVGVTWSGTRPAVHWDATFTERLTPDVLGQTMPWSLHVGESFADVPAFVLLAREGMGYMPSPCVPPNLYADVPETSVFCDVIEELTRRGVVTGCAAGSYCPTAAVSRDQMPVFVLRVLDPALDPPACTTPMFTDVPATSPYCRWIEEAARRGVVTGCGAGNYCPTAPVTREQMAVFLVGTYGLNLYGP